MKKTHRNSIYKTENEKKKQMNNVKSELANES